MPIEQNAPELERIVSSGQNIEKLGEGYGGGDGPAEGPLWWKEGNYLLFSDIHNNRRMKWAQGQGVTLFQEPTNRANGLTRDLQGRGSWQPSTIAAGSLAKSPTAASPWWLTALRVNG